MFNHRLSYLFLSLIIAACNSTTPVRNNEYRIPLEAPTGKPTTKVPATQPLASISGYKKGIYVNGEALGLGDQISVMPGVASIKFDGIARSTEVTENVEVIPRKDHTKAKTIACIALLPLCPAIMSLNTEGSAKTIMRTKATDMWCLGSTDFEVHANARYIVSILIDEASHPILQIKEEEPDPYRRAKKILECRTVEEIITNS